jgi:hypothetical protein
VDKNAFNAAQTKLKHVLEEGLDNKVITMSEFEAMDPDGKNPAKFSARLKSTKHMSL